jgi:hypothetical protein
LDKTLTNNQKKKGFAGDISSICGVKSHPPHHYVENAGFFPVDDFA